MFRTQYTGYQLGVPAEVLAYRILRGSAAKEKEGMRKLSATTLLYDIPIRPSTPGFALLKPRADRPKAVAGQRVEEDIFDVMVKLWKMRDQFGAKEAQKLFYWNNQDYVRVSPENCYALLLKHPKNGVLAFISNLSKDAQTVTVQFNLDKLGLRGRKLDVFAPLDLGIRAGIQREYRLGQMPDVAACEQMAQTWAPFRSVACLYLWRSGDLEL